MLSDCTTLDGLNNALGVVGQAAWAATALPLSVREAVQAANGSAYARLGLANPNASDTTYIETIAMWAQQHARATASWHLASDQLLNSSVGAQLSSLDNRLDHLDAIRDSAWPGPPETTDPFGIKL